MYGGETIEKTVSGYYIAEELSSTYMGMLIAIPEEDGVVFELLSQNLSLFNYYESWPKRSI